MRRNTKTCTGMAVFSLSFTLAVCVGFGIAYCRGFLLLSQAGSTCSNSTVLVCSYNNSMHVGMQEFNADQNIFKTLTSNRIARNPDFEESSGNDVYKLRISQVMKYNGTQYRCFGFNENVELQYSNQWKVVLPTKDVCADLKINNTNKVDSNSTSVANGTKEVDAAPRSIPGHTSALIAVVTTIMTVGVCLLGTTLGVIIVRRFRLKTTQSNELTVQGHSCLKSLQASVQADGDVAGRESPVIAEAVVKAHISVPDDVSNEVLQSPQVASTNDEAEAIQILGAVLKYDNVRLRLNPSLMHYDVQRSPAVPFGVTPPPLICHSSPLIRSRSGIDSEDVSMVQNPAYVVIDSYHQSRPEEATDGSFHQSTSPGTLSEDPPLHSNPAYKTLEIVNQASPTAVRQEHQLQPTGGTEPSEDVPMQHNPAYGMFESTC